VDRQTVEAMTTSRADALARYAFAIVGKIDTFIAGRWHCNRASWCDIVTVTGTSPV